MVLCFEYAVRIHSDIPLAYVNHKEGNKAMKRETLRRIVGVLLVLSLTVGIIPATAASARADGQYVSEPVGDDYAEQEADEIAPIIGGDLIDVGSDEPVRVSIVLEEDSTIAAGFDPKTVSTDLRAIAYRSSLEAAQEEMAAVIEDEVLDEGQMLDVVWNLTLAANIISANVPQDAVESIAGLPGVKEVVIEIPCYPQVIDIGGELEPHMAISGEMNGTQTVWKSGYTGAGMQIAIIDTGLDLQHISFSSTAFDHAIDELKAEGKTVDLVTRDFLADKLTSLNVYKRDNSLTAEKLYKNSKVPFAYNYNDKDHENVGHDNDQQGEHGSHVAGIAAANRYVDKDGDGQLEKALDSVLTAGNAPDAQIIVMKVFGARSGAVASDYMAAIEDAIVLGADAINLSLGSRFAGFVKDSAYERIMRDLETSSAVVSISSGNNSYWAENTNPGALYADGINFATDASPGTYKNAFTVASIDNLGIISPTVEVDGEKYTYTESSGPNKPISELALESKAYDYIYIDGVGEDKDGKQFCEEARACGKQRRRRLYRRQQYRRHGQHGAYGFQGIYPVPLHPPGGRRGHQESVYPGVRRGSDDCAILQGYRLYSQRGSQRQQGRDRFRHGERFQLLGRPRRFDFEARDLSARRKYLLRLRLQHCRGLRESGSQ